MFKEFVLIFVLLITILFFAAQISSNDSYVEHNTPKVRFADVVAERVFSKRTGSILADNEILIN